MYILIYTSNYLYNMKLLSYTEFINELIINELFVHKSENDTNLNNKHLILYKKDLYIFDDSNWLEILENIKDLTSITSTNMSSVLDNLSRRPDIIVGVIQDNTIYIENKSNYGSGIFNHSEQSPDLIKLKKELNMPIKIAFKDQHIDRNLDLMKLKDRTFYHGTCFKYLESILKKGIIPTDTSNFDFIKHTDKIFMTLNIEKAVIHANLTAEKNDSFPVIIAFKIPDVSKLIPDFDLGNVAYGGESEIMKRYYPNSSNSQHGYLDKNLKNKDITNKHSIYGYVGRIPASMVTNIIIDIDSYNSYIENGNIDVSYVKFWDKLDKNSAIETFF